MAFPPVFHPPAGSGRFGSVLLVEIAPPSDRQPCRYDEVLAAGSRPPARTHFAVPQAAARAVLQRVERGVAVDAVVFGGAGEPLRQRGLGSILRKIRTATHLPTLLLTNGVLLGDREVRREVAEADTVVTWLPALQEGPKNDPARADAWEAHVEGIGSLRREEQVRIALEIPVLAGRNDGAESRDAWRRAADRIRPDRIFVLPHPRGPAADPEVLEAVRRAVSPSAEVHVPEGGPVDCRCWCEPAG